MKLIMCTFCKDVFRLRVGLRKCECGKIQGRYISNRTAEVSPNSISIAIGNGSLNEAIDKMNTLFKNTNGEADRNAYMMEANIKYAWVRPNSGNGNPHTEILDDLETFYV